VPQKCKVPLEYPTDIFELTYPFKRHLSVSQAHILIVADRARGLKMKVIGYDPYLSKEVAEKKGVDVVSLDELLGRSDFISVHTPLTDETRNLIDKNHPPDPIGDNENLPIPGVLILRLDSPIYYANAQT
jgi:hypothetical protein